MKPCQTDKLLIHAQILDRKTKITIIKSTPRLKLNLFKVKHLWNQIRIRLILQNKILCKSQNSLLRRYLQANTNSICRSATTTFWSSFINSNNNKLKLKRNVYDYNINNEMKVQIYFYENKNWSVISLYNTWTNLIPSLNMIIFLRQRLNFYLQHQEKYHHNRLQELKFPFLHHSFFMSLQKDKNERLIRMLLTSLKSSYVIHDILSRLKNTLMIFIQSLWLENTMTLFCVVFNIRLANQVLLMFLSL